MTQDSKLVHVLGVVFLKGTGGLHSKQRLNMSTLFICYHMLQVLLCGVNERSKLSKMTPHVNLLKLFNLLLCRGKGGYILKITRRVNFLRMLNVLFCRVKGL